MLTCNLLLTLCLLQVSPPTSVPADQAAPHSVAARDIPYFLAANQISLSETSALAAKAWLPNPQQAPVTTATPALPLNTPPTEQTQLTVFPHSDTARYWISGQANSIFQLHGNFHSPYQGTNSFTAPFQYKASEVGTLYLAYQLNKNLRYETDAIYDEENAGGRGLSQAQGLAGFTNLDVVRNPNLGPVPYTARVQLHQPSALQIRLCPRSHLSCPGNPGPSATPRSRVGKFTLPDTFDINAVLTDSHLQFENWTVDNNGAWDYAADTRGYTYGVALEYDDRDWSLRYVLALMPTVANGITLDWDLRQARAQIWSSKFARLSCPAATARSACSPMAITPTWAIIARQSRTILPA